MASLRVLTFDHEGGLIQFDTWLDDLQLYLLSDSRDSVSLFDHTSGASLDPPATADSATRSQWLTPETSIVTVGAARGTPRTPFFEGCSPSPLAPSYASAAAVDVLGAEDAGATSASGSAVVARARVAGVVALAARVVVGVAVEVVEVVEVVAAVGVVAGVGALVATVVAAVGVAVVAAVGVVAVMVEPFGGEVLAVASGSSSSVGARPLRPSSFVSGFLSVGRLG
ncbi:unnamed protein product, partial [Closterium sp. NIES-54]